MMPTQDPIGPPTEPATVPPYTRADAITDGLLIEAPPKLTRMFRFPYPVAVTQTAWHDAVAWDAQTEAGKPARPGSPSPAASPRSSGPHGTPSTPTAPGRTTSNS